MTFFFENTPCSQNFKKVTPKTNDPLVVTPINSLSSEQPTNGLFAALCSPHSELMGVRLAGICLGLYY